MSTKGQSMRRASVIALLACAGSSGLAFAQSVDQDADADAAIVVTATRRAEALQDVPAAVSALGEQQLLDRGAREIQDYILAVPGVSFEDNGEGSVSFVIRGVSSLNGAGTTSIYVDETPASADLRLFDVDRVEVLRGPQGTLFGISTEGGAIRTITNKPQTDRYAATIEASVGKNGEASDLDHALNAMVNIPLVQDKLALRIVGYHEIERGYIDLHKAEIDDALEDVVTLDETLKEDAGDRTIDGLRAALGFTPTAQLNITGTYYYQKEESEGFLTSDSDLYGDDFANSRVFVDSLETDYQIANLTVDADLGFADLVSSTSYSRSTSDEVLDVSTYYGAYPFLFNFIMPLIGGDAFLTGEDVQSVSLTTDLEADDFTQEVRLASSGDGKFGWILGAFYNETSAEQVQRIPINPIISVNLPPEGLLARTDIEIETQEVAAFAELSYQITPALKVTGGVRRYSLEYTDKRIRYAYPFALYGLIANGTPLNPDPVNAEEEGNTYKANISYKVNERALFYAQAASGYRQGGGNSPSPLEGQPGETVPRQYTTDKLWQYEAGFRAATPDQHVTLNGALFYTDWADLQSLAQTPSGFNYYTNAGDAHTMGLELETTARPWVGGLLGGALTFTTAEFDTNNPTEGVEAGDPVPNIPEVSYSVYAQQTFPVTDALDGYARADFSYVGDRPSPALNQTALTAYSLVNLRAGVRKGDWELSAFVNNATNEQEVIGDGLFGVNYLRPRTVGLRLRGSY